MASRQFHTMIPGEASETDSDEELMATSLPVAVELIVQGEAVETDDDDEEEIDNEGVRVEVDRRHMFPFVSISKSLPELKVDRLLPKDGDMDKERESHTSAEEVSTRPPASWEPHGSILQQKLREGNVRLRSDTAALVNCVYATAAKEVRVIGHQLATAQAAAAEASASLCQSLNNLRAVQDVLDIVVSCSLLPDIRIPAEANIP
uniref:biogenesis of lysosome-related organelles complex 1 subunit 3 n=1 Tax=Myxine glutinosa TaxID=7769 RepID=UPI00358F24C9